MRRFDDDDEVDLVIVGCGAGGGVLPQRLARAGWKVVAFDAGPFWDPDRDWVSDEVGLAPPVLDRAPRHRRRRPGAARRRTTPAAASAASTVHFAGYTPALPPLRLPHRRRRRRRRRLADQLPRPASPTTRDIEAGAARSPGSTGRGATRTATRMSPHPVGGRRICRSNGLPARSGSTSGSARSRSPTAGSATGRTASTAGSACRAARSTPRPPPLITHVPDALAHGAEIRPDSMVTRIEVDERRPGHRRHLLPRRRRAPPAGPGRRRRRLLHRDATAAAQLGLPPRSPTGCATTTTWSAAT